MKTDRITHAMGNRLCLSWLLTIDLLFVSCAASPVRDVGEMEGTDGMDEPGQSHSGLDAPSEPVDETLDGPFDGTPPPPTKPPRPPPQSPSAREAASPNTAPRKDPPEAPPPKAAPPASRKAAEQVAQILADLQDREKADAAFRRLWTAPKTLIPLLIEEVENPAPSQVEQIQVLVVDPEFVGKAKLFLATRLRGLGKMEEIEEATKDDWRIISQAYTKMSYGITPNKKNYRVLIEKYGGFELGVVIRAGLMNRFRSTRFPSLDDDAPRPGALIEWWRQYYKRVSADLPPP